MPRKRHLTEEEKAQIWTYHRENPLVTHLDVAAFFGVERSTVSKIVHQEQKQWQNPRNDSDQSSSSYQELPHGPLPNLKVECALDEYFRDSQRKGLPVTWAMVRKKAAIVAATTWMENKQKGTNRPAHMEGCGSRASSIHLIGPGDSPSSVLISKAQSSQIYSGDAEIQPQIPPDEVIFPLTHEVLQMGDESLTCLTSNTSNPIYLFDDSSPPLQGATSLQDCASYAEVDSEVDNALDLLSRHFAQSDKLTTRDLICLSHLQDRVRSRRG